MKTNYSKSLLIALFLGASFASYSQIITTIAGSGSIGAYSGDGGAATAAKFNFPASIAVDASGNIYVADSWNNRIRVINGEGIINTFAGNGLGNFSGDGGQGIDAELFQPTGVAVDASGNVYIADSYNSRIRKVNKSGVITTIAGSGYNAPGGGAFSGDGGKAINAELNRPSGVAIDASGNIYIADLQNFRIREVNISGIINTIAGNGYRNYSGDGGHAINAELTQPNGVAVDVNGNVYISDWENNRIRIVNGAGIINTFAGNGIAKYTGDGGPAMDAELNAPANVAFDNEGNVYIANYGDNSIRKVDASGIISNFAGSGFDSPTDIAVDASGNIYIADRDNQRIRKVTMNVTGINEIASVPNEVNVYPVPNTGSFTVTGITQGQVIELYNYIGEMVLSAISHQPSANYDISTMANGIYLVKILNTDGSIAAQKKMVKIN